MNCLKIIVSFGNYSQGQKNKGCRSILRHPLSAGGNQLINRIALGGEFLFVFGHYISLVHLRIPVEIPGASEKLPPGGPDAFQGEIKEGFIVCFEFQLS